VTEKRHRTARAEPNCPVLNTHTDATATDRRRTHRSPGYNPARDYLLREKPTADRSSPSHASSVDDRPLPAWPLSTPRTGKRCPSTKDLRLLAVTLHEQSVKDIHDGTYRT